jgi:hypothetical protein
MILGLRCPGCGLTDSFVLLAGGDLSGAVAANPLGPVLFAMLVLIILTRLIKARWPAVRAWRAIDAALGALVIAALVVRTVAFYLG